MKRLSDHTGDEAIELWADLFDPLSKIFTDEKVRKIIASGQPKLLIAKEILRSHKAEAVEIMLRIDPEPINGLNVVLRLVSLISEIAEHEELKSFFGYAEKVKTDKGSFGSATENTEAKEN